MKCSHCKKELSLSDISYVVDAVVYYDIEIQNNDIVYVEGNVEAIGNNPAYICKFCNEELRVTEEDLLKLK